MLTNAGHPLIAIAGKDELVINPGMINRHGLITGATGTGKTVSLQTLAETFSDMGIPVFMADVKGDLSGISREGIDAGKIGKRAEELKLKEKGRHIHSFPVRFWDVYGKNGHPMRATVSEVGPIIMARVLNLNDVQTGVLQIIFKVADDNGLLLLDLKDLRSMTQHVSDEREAYRTQYGQVSPASIGAIQRALLRLEEEGGDSFFGEPALQLDDLLSLDHGRGVINILDATTLINRPGLYSCVLLWLLSELFERLPEAGDLQKPRLVFFFDEAHLLFDGISPVLLQKIEQVVRLIRSRGVGVYFVSQNPADIPDSILGQLGNRIQHALRAFTPKDQKCVKAAAQAFRPNPEFSTEKVIGELAVGEALISFLDGNGTPEIVQRSLIVPPEGQVGPITASERDEIIRTSSVAGKYDEAVDRESAYEILNARAQMLQAMHDGEERRKNEEKARKEQIKHLQEQEKEARRLEREQARANKGSLNDILGSIAKTAARTATNTVGREFGKQILRGVLGSLFGGKR